MKKPCNTNHRKKIALRRSAFSLGNVFPPHEPNGTTFAAERPNGDDRSRPTTSEQPGASATVLDELRGALDHVTARNHPRTFKLLQSGRRKLARKVIEEACEVTVEAVKRDASGVIRESADLLYQLVVLWFHIGIEPREVWHEMETRAATLGIAEKLPKLFGMDAISNDPDC
jgi:phosphoribosyl-ATP pyrophosphohydrolase